MIRPKAEYRIFSEVREKSGEQLGEFNTAKQVHMTLARQITYNKDLCDWCYLYFWKYIIKYFWKTKVTSPSRVNLARVRLTVFRNRNKWNRSSRNQLFWHSLHCNILQSAWNKIFWCEYRLRSPKITVQENYGNKTFSCSYTLNTINLTHP